MPFKVHQFLTGLFLFFIAGSLSAQQYGFEWIKPGQDYYKFSVGKTATYRIGPDALLNAGLNLNLVNPNRFQFFYKGQEIPVYISGAADNLFNEDDFIEFVGFKNNGNIDSVLYANKSWQPNAINGLFTDTSVYFLTILPDADLTLPLRYTQSNDNNFTGLVPETYFMDTVAIAPTEEYLDGPEVRTASDKYVGSEYDDGEGWASFRVSWGAGRVFNLVTPAYYSAGPAPRIQYKLIGGSNGEFMTGGLGINHHAVVSISPNNSAYTSLSDETFRAYETRLYSSALTNAQVGNTTYLKLTIPNNLNVRADHVCLSYALVTYPRLFDLNGQTQKWFQVTHQQGASNSFIQMQNVGYPGQTNAYVLDVTGQKRIATQFSNGTARFMIGNDGKPHNLWMYDSLQAITITRVTKVSFPVINPADNNEFLIITHPVLEPAAGNYANYRSKKYKVLKVYSDQLYDYYYYGHKHPHAVQRFTRHLINTQTTMPKYLLLAGRGYQNDKARFYNVASTNPVSNYNRNLVPAIGVPGADALFTNGVKGDGFYAEIPTGRVSATNSDSLQNYLDKLITYEESSDSILPWRKHVLHVSGGTNAQGGQDQQGDFRNQMRNYANMIIGPDLGAKVTTFSKSSSDPTQVDMRDPIVAVQNGGVGLVSFLGHASLTILDVDIGGISLLKNKDRYPFYYFSGCNVGNATEDDPKDAVIYSKDYLCTANAGAIGWLAHSNFSFTDQLPPLMTGFYSRYAKTNYGASIGTVIYNITKGLSNGSLSTRTSNLQWVLQGDPALVLYSPSAPDYTLAESDVYVTSQVSTQNEFLDIGVIVNNYGKTSDDTIAIRVNRKLPNNQSVSYPVKYYPGVYNKDTFFIRMEMLGDLALGNNNLEIVIDANNDVPEIYEDNNRVNINVFVPGNGLSRLFPETDAVVGEDTAWIIVQNNNIQSTSNEFIIEVDVTNQFNSSQKVSSGIVKSSALLRWPFRITATDTTTYYWRARLNVSEQDGGRWSSSAFTYIPSHTKAWMQRTFPRFIDVSSSNLLEVDTPAQKLDFSGNIAIIDVLASRFAHSGRGVYYGENINPQLLSCIPNGFAVILFDQRTLQPMINPRFPMNCANVIAHNQANPGSKWYYYGFANSASGQEEFRRFVDSTDEGTYVSLFSVYNNGNATWSNATREAFQKIGSTKVAALNSDTSAFVLVGRKGAAIGTIPEDTFYSLKSDTFVILDNVVLHGKWYTASATSKQIGPARNWKNVQYKYDPTENAGIDDHNKIAIIGVDKNSRDTILVENATNGYDLGNIDASVYPYLKLSVTWYDTTHRTLDQLRYWMVNYDPLPEGTISIDDGFAFHAASLDQGDSLSIDLAFRNISEENFDSIPTLLRIMDENRVVKYQWRENLGALPQSNVIKLSRKIPTYNLSGQHGMEIYFNDGPQAELTKVNNYLYKNFEVKADKTNPVLDVTFDGYRIVNGDFVSPKTVIRITSKDDSKFKLQNDTSSFILYVRKPNAADFVQVSLDDARVIFKPATNSANKAELEFRADFNTDGAYTLKVLSKDASGNAAGGNFYEIDFTVESKSTITNFFPYPNPATTNVKFVFTLTGASPPDQLLIRIMTVSGRIVKEINKDEFGPIKIGQNLSQYSWDGTDNFGDRLANGVYLYQVLTRINGNSLEKRQTQADNYFLQNVGKIYLMK